MEKWTELKKGDILYLAVPQWDDNNLFIGYKFQETNVISNKLNNNNNGCVLRFKFTNCRGKRTRIQIPIFLKNIEQKVLTLPNNFDNAHHIGDLLISFENEKAFISILADIYKDFKEYSKHIIQALSSSYVSLLNKKKITF